MPSGLSSGNSSDARSASMTSISSSEARPARGLPLQLLPAVRSGGQVDGAGPPIAGRLAGRGLEPLEDPDAALDQLPGACGRTCQGHQPGCVPRGPRGQPLALQQHDVGPAELGQVVGDAAADDASADHDHAGPVGQRIRHVVPPVVRAVSVRLSERSVRTEVKPRASTMDG